MVEYIFPALEFLQRELLLFASFCFLAGSIDDAAFDGLWILHVIRRKFFVCRKYRKATVETLSGKAVNRKAGAMAVFVPAWQEATVIGGMLERCREQWSHAHYRIYVGCYPNDGDTVAAAAVAARGADNIRLVICANDGPTSKADCLNRLWQALCEDEICESMAFRAVVLQDAEDLVHPGALDLFSHLIGRASLVQIPVIPRRTKHARWIAGHYSDEFAELHGKQMVLREALGVSIPSAGVGCALARDALGKLSLRTQSRPFDAASLTEDYELGLHLTEGSERGIFARIRDRQGQLVATQEFFPDKLGDAVRQKSRWLAGIALSGWDRMGWRKCWRENWMRLRDRKASVAALVLMLAYVAVVLTGILIIASLVGVHQTEPVSGLLKTMLAVNAAFLVWRLFLKACFVFNLYGLTEAIYSIPRTMVANLINILAARRAILSYLRNISGKPVCWEKTAHFHPAGAEIQRLKTMTKMLQND